jgi:hypothetical protein
MPHAALIAGSRAAALAALNPPATSTALAILPDAAAVFKLAPTLLTGALAPLYGRGPDATPMAERITA